MSSCDEAMFYLRERGLTPYDSRRTFMTNGEGAKVPMLTLKRLVNHATGEADVTAGYIGTDRDAGGE